MRWPGSWLPVLALLPLPGQVPHQNHPPRGAGELARVLEDPSRDQWQKPHEVIEALQLRPDEVIADIGAGTGYFARRFARHCGKVFAVDIEPALLEAAARNAPPNLVTLLAAPDDPKLPEASLDTVFFCDVLHHIAGRPAYYRKLRRALKPGGRLVVIDFHKRRLPVGPPPAMKLSREEVEQELQGAGFRLTRSWPILPHQYFLEFRTE